LNTKNNPITKTLYLIPTTISEQRTDTIPQSTISVIHSTNCFIVERLRTARRFISSTHPPYKINDLHLIELDKRDNTVSQEIIDVFKTGRPLGLMSEAGMPAIADPGSEIVGLAHKFGYRVVPCVGPSSIFLALAASGMNGQFFCFHGYLPIKEDKLRMKLKLLEKSVLSKNGSQIFIETPYRNQRLLQTILKLSSKELYLAVCIDITGNNENIRSQSIIEWRKSKVELPKLPTIFILGTR